MATQARVLPGRVAKPDARHYLVELEDEKVRILRIRYGPRESSAMEAHPALMGVMLTDCRLRFTYPDGTAEDVTAKRGEFMSFPAVEHSTENLSSQPFEAMAIQLKP